MYDLFVEVEINNIEFSFDLVFLKIYIYKQEMSELIDQIIMFIVIYNYLR